MNDPHEHPKTVDWPPKDTDWSGSDEDTLAPGDDASGDTSQLSKIGRYRIIKTLGQGGFGRVYLAHDDELDRSVAIKVPRKDRLTDLADVEEYITEARTLASLDHPSIVPVFDVGRTDDGLCFVVSKYVEGSDLAARIQDNRPSHSEAAEFVATVAEALHYAHTQGLVHRDIKPANILLDNQGRPYVADFGLALKEADFGKGAGFAGTPAYMSPEQARGEGHRVDGRSDIFSLGVVFYELLTGKKPFRGDSIREILDHISSVEVRPPRQIVDRIPRELERICLKALSKRATDRYTTAQDLADDLRHFLKKTVEDTTAPQAEAVATSPVATADTGEFDSSDKPSVKIVPKGLRSFDAHDADFFLELLPGPRDREGLPDSLRFWKTRIEETDSDSTFSVGLIYGPSGCGKSSLVKAGLVPRLSDNVIPVYIEATPEETENGLLHGLHKRCPAVDHNLDLKETVAVLRRGQGIPSGKKVLLVLDQFEQWLHAKKEEEDSQLVQALRQCDGSRVQCIVMVRDDFWMAATRFMRELEVRLVEAQNSAAVDLFSIRHAEKVLSAFGRAFGALPDESSKTSKEQQEFLQQSVSGLAEEGKVICVRLALFADMMKGKPWTPVTLKEVGGTKGIGATFLEETFSSSTASPEHRYHQKAARAVLKALLPQSGTDIKGEMKSHDELLEASGYAHRPKDFDALLRILDSEIRLITPTDPEGVQSEDDSVSHADPSQKYYQLTHDYLVPSLREWLTRKQKETKKGRAELRLADRSALWNAKPENRHLPSLLDWVRIRTLTDKRKWSRSQRKMMKKAGKVHGIRSGIVAVLLSLAIVTGITVRRAVEESQQQLVAQKQEEQNDAEATRLVEGLLQADTSQVPAIVDNLDHYRAWAKDDLSRAFDESPDDSNAKLHAALAILPEDESVLPFLKDRLLTVSPMQFEHVRNFLEKHKTDLIADYWKIVSDGSQDPARRFQAACALASYDPDNERWQDQEFGKFVAEHLVSVLPSELLPWRNALRPVQEHLTAHLPAIYRNNQAGEQVRGFATDTLADYLSDDAEGLFDLLADANQRQFGPIFEKIVAHQERAISLGNVEVAKTPAPDASEDDKDALAIRQANAAVMLLRMNASDQVWPLLRHSPDPRVRSYIIHWLSTRDGDPKTIIARYEQETDVTIKRALLLCLGEFDESRFSQIQRKPLVETLLTVYRTDTDSGLHAAAEWLLRRWGQAEKIAAIDKELKQNEEQRTADKENNRQWYVNSQGQTYVILYADEFQMGTPESEPGRMTNERLHQRMIGRCIAISAKEVTITQWRKFNPDHPGLYNRTDDAPVLGIKWYKAAWYCNWLSEQEGIPKEQWCYLPNGEDKYGPGMKAKANFLELTGYRLPTAAEWEFACRAGARTSRYYGLSEMLLPNYAWYLANAEDHTRPVASVKPNDFGLFDMYGNAIEWCYDVYGGYSATETVRDAPGIDVVLETRERVIRGGGFHYQPRYVRSAYRYARQPGTKVNDIGIRPARTYNLLP